jgi:hypothetical protein
MPGAFELAVAGVVAVAVALRVLLMIAYAPVILSYSDEGSYVGAAAGKLFSNPFRPAGYSLFLKAVHVLSASLPVTVAVQHLIGLATSVVVYGITRRIGASRWTALLPAAVVALSGDQLYFEHVLLSDGLFATLTLLACSCGLRVAAANRAGSHGSSLRWALTAGALAAVAVTFRTVGVVSAGVLIVWLLVVSGPNLRRRVASAGAAGLICAGLLLAYAFAQQSQTGVFGLTRFGGWPLYARVATFADCAKFTPPAGTRGLCQTLPPSERPAAWTYDWSSESPAQRLFGPPPAGGGKLGAFAHAAIVAQPGDYLSAVASDFALYFWPYRFTGAAEYSLDERASPTVTASNLPPVRAYWGPVVVHVHESIARFLERWRGIVRIHPWMLALGALLGLAGILLASDRASREGLALLWASALALLLGSVAVSNYDFRYGVPPAMLLVIVGARGAELITQRLTASRHPLPHPGG